MYTRVDIIFGKPQADKLVKAFQDYGYKAYASYVKKRFYYAIMVDKNGGFYTLLREFIYGLDFSYFDEDGIRLCSKDEALTEAILDDEELVVAKCRKVGDEIVAFDMLNNEICRRVRTDI